MALMHYLFTCKLVIIATLSIRVKAVLYDSSCKVTVLDHKNFHATVYNSDKVWFVEFYSSWCGHCIHFAPTWKSFAKKVERWKPIADVAAIDCANTDNRGVCNKHEVHAYPSLRIFNPFSKPENKTSSFIYKGGRDLTTLIQVLAVQVEKNAASLRLPNWPNFQPANATWVADFFRHQPRYQFLVVIFQGDDNFLSKEIILDVAGQDWVAARWMKKADNPLITKWGVDAFPSVYILDRTGTPTKIAGSDRESFTAVILSHIKENRDKLPTIEKSKEKENADQAVIAKPADQETDFLADDDGNEIINDDNGEIIDKSRFLLPLLGGEEKSEGDEDGSNMDGRNEEEADLGGNKGDGGFIKEDGGNVKEDGGNVKEDGGMVKDDRGNVKEDAEMKEDLLEVGAIEAVKDDGMGISRLINPEGGGGGGGDIMEGGGVGNFEDGVGDGQGILLDKSKGGQKGGGGEGGEWEGEIVGGDAGEILGGEGDRAPAGGGGEGNKDPDGDKDAMWGRMMVKNKEKAMQVKENTRLLDRRPSEWPKVYMLDLESTIHYSLRHEVALRSHIEGDALIALINYVDALKMYFPGRKSVIHFLESTHQWLLHRQGMRIPVDDWLEAVHPKKAPGSGLAERLEWAGCLGSESHFRGYPCGLWTLFHTLTISQASLTRRYDRVHYMDVLQAMRGYILSFFSCANCRDNFRLEVAELDSAVTSLDGAILWLWRTHNRVNRRLHGDPSEDPHHPKETFPPRYLCASCYSSTNVEQWEESRVLGFLKEFYGPRNFDLSRLHGINEVTKAIVNVGENDAVGAADTIDGPERTDVTLDPDRVRREILLHMRMREMDFRLAVETRKAGYLGLGINKIDVSMCMVLNIGCVSLIVCVYFVLVWRRRRKRKSRLLP